MSTTAMCDLHFSWSTTADNRTIAQSKGTDEGDENIEEIEHLFELAEKDVDEFSDNFVGGRKLEFSFHIYQRIKV
jgi:hypothetical protein